MAETELDVKSTDDWKTKALIIGAVIGAAAGAGAAYLFVQQAERSGNKPEVTAGDGVRLALLVLGLLRQVAALGE
ncbi:MAG: hypothetical protein P8074_14150 [Anaerolineales bacterium]